MAECFPEFMSELTGETGDEVLSPLSRIHRYVRTYYLYQVLVVEQARVFIDNLASTGENMLLNFDNFLTVDDVIKGRKSVRVIAC